MRRAALAALVALAVSASGALSQTSPSALIERSRAQMQNFEEDAAYAGLNQALRMTAITRDERVRALTLLAIIEVGARRNTIASRDAFVLALRLDPRLSIDSLEFLESEAKVVFAQARTIVPMPAEPAATQVEAALFLAPILARDTVVSIDDARYVIGAQVNRNAQVVASVAPADNPSQPIWIDTIAMGAPRELAWPLRQSSGEFVAEGSYLLRMQATDPSGMATRILEQHLRVARVVPDTQSHPVPLAPSAFAPETLSVATRTTKVLLTGGAFAAAAALAPMVMGNPDLNGSLGADPTSFVVAGGVAAISIARFFKGGKPAVISAENVARNRELRDNWARQRDAIVTANATAHARAGIRVAMETP